MSEKSAAISCTSPETALECFSRSLIDYAGLFPPAGLPMPEVISNFAHYVEGRVAGTGDSSMLARLIIPAARLAEFEKLAQPKFSSSGTPWRISALVAPVDAIEQAFDFGMSGIRQFNQRHADGNSKNAGGTAVIDAIEIKAVTEANAGETISRLRNDRLSVFIELPHSDDPGRLINAIARQNCSEYEARFFAKIRTGGVTSDLIPSVEQVARFIYCCADNMLGLKATAGLHHPVRGEFALTYEKDADRGVMHGFANVFAAMCGAFAYGFSESQIMRVLETTSTDDFQFDGETLTVCGTSMSAMRIKAVRRLFAHSFGSCSFDEPRAELRELIGGL